MNLKNLSPFGDKFRLSGQTAQLSFILFLWLGTVSACVPILDRSMLGEEVRQVSFTELRDNPESFKGRVYALGGVIVETKFVEAGSQIEAMHVPVDRFGYFEDRGRSEGRFLALLPGDLKDLDPVIYHRGRRVTLAGEFLEIRPGRIDEAEYQYPVFLIRQIYLWPVQKERPPALYYDPWLYPYPYYYRHPWWFYPGLYAPAPIRRDLRP